MEFLIKALPWIHKNVREFHYCSEYKVWNNSNKIIRTCLKIPFLFALLEQFHKFCQEILRISIIQKVFMDSLKLFLSTSKYIYIYITFFHIMGYLKFFCQSYVTSLEMFDNWRCILLIADMRYDIYRISWKIQLPIV